MNGPNTYMLHLEWFYNENWEITFSRGMDMPLLTLYFTLDSHILIIILYKYKMKICPRW